MGIPPPEQAVLLALDRRGHAREVGARAVSVNPNGTPLLPDQAVLLALDRGEREREMVSQLLAALCPAPLPRDAAAQGFTDLMLSCEARPFVW